MIPGSEFYYLSRLGRLELLGIPQIVHEPLRCNSNKARIVPGMFQRIKNYSEDNTLPKLDDIHTYNVFSNIHNESRVDSNDGSAMESTSGEFQEELFGDLLGIEGIGQDATRGIWFYKDKVKHPDVFSEHEFKCCVKLGEFTTSSDNCCSNHAVFIDPAEKDKGMTCRLPYGTNLNVYFNRFVSSDGLLEDAIAREDDDPIGFKLSDLHSRHR